MQDTVPPEDEKNCLKKVTDAKSALFWEIVVHLQTVPCSAHQYGFQGWFSRLKTFIVCVSISALKDSILSEVHKRHLKVTVKHLSLEENANEKKRDYSLRMSLDQSLTETSSLNISSLTAEQINDIVGVNCSVHCEKIILEKENIHHMSTKRKLSIKNYDSSPSRNVSKKQRLTRSNGTH